MTQGDENLQIAQTARLLTPDAVGADSVLRALQQHLSLKASPLDKAPLQTFAEVKQRIYCQSSGSTGAPKLIRRSPASWRASFKSNGHQFGIGPKDTYGVLGHLGHSLSLYAALESLDLGSGLALLAGSGPRRQALALRQLGVTTIYATPSQMQLIAQADPNAFLNIDRIFVGGGAVHRELRDQLTNSFPNAKLIEFFGASETSFVTLGDEHTPLGSVGRAYPGVSLKIGDDDAINQTGEIWVQSPYLFEGYQEGGNVLTRWRDGYLSIGEFGRLDPGGYLYLHGRKSRMVTVADQNVFPEAIENVLLAQPNVDAAAVITPQDALRGHIIVAAVVGTANAADLRGACRDQLGDAAVPRIIWDIPEMPLLTAGKPNLPRLQTLWQERHG